MEKTEIMGTKFILIGGYMYKARDGGKAFAEELVRDFDSPVKILDCLFARPRENWAQLFEGDKDFFSKSLPEARLEFQCADPVRFIEQVRWADAIYIRGGDAEKLLIELLHSGGDLLKEFKGKTVAGASAGADAIAKYYYGLDEVKIEEGLGFLPLKVIVHWQSDYNAPHIDWDKAYQELQAYGEDLPVVTLREGEYKVFSAAQ